MVNYEQHQQDLPVEMAAAVPVFSQNGIRRFFRWKRQPDPSGFSQNGSHLISRREMVAGLIRVFTVWHPRDHSLEKAAASPVFPQWGCSVRYYAEGESNAGHFGALARYFLPFAVTSRRKLCKFAFHQPVCPS